MEDEQIVQLYWDRNESAIEESSKKYGSYVRQIACRILNDIADAEECVNDTWLRAWNAIPPQRPTVLGAFFGKITRNLSFDMYRKARRGKRGGTEIDLVLDELGECVSGQEDTETRWESKELVREINRFLNSLPRTKRDMFVLRYWYADSIHAIADRYQTTENNVSVTLSRLRKKLRTHLTERGYDI
ncbi:MAG: sigma-70 family RNA polymerase sigma factor [Clostridiales bacterium]|nr:sigma-70 family RNA polymerase sigma factor [Clostridiales bacterium]